MASYIWSDSTGEGYNRWVLFRHAFVMEGEPTDGTLHLFADTRYRLMLNGVVLGHGPARFRVQHPEYDTYDLLPFLRQGENVLAVVVNGYGTSSFHSDASIGGLIAWGDACDADGRQVSFATGPDWRALESPGHTSDADCVSFALHAGEWLDARRMPAGWEQPGFDDSGWPAAVLLGRQDHWGPLRPRSIPPLDEREVLPERRLGAWAAVPCADEELYAFSAILPSRSNHDVRGAITAMTYLHSPREQEVTFGAWWGYYWVNGEPLKGTPRPGVGLRQEFTARLREGWNLFQVFERPGGPFWQFLLGLPRTAGLTVSADRDTPGTFLVGGPWEGEDARLAEEALRPLASPDALPAALGPWKRRQATDTPESPWFARAFRRLVRLDEGSGLPVEGSAFPSEQPLVLTYDFGTEVLGRPILELTAAAGTVIDLAYTERLDADGCADPYAQPWIRMAERYTARAGEQRWQAMHPRGMRYLQLVVRGDLSRFALHRVALSRANYPVRQIGAFACSDPVLNRIWEIGRDTQFACMEDTYLDCPWRERGLYAGDTLVQFFINLAAFGDTKLMRRTVELFFFRQEGAGPPRAGGNLDYAAIPVLALWDYFSRSGDAGFAREIFPRLQPLLEGLQAWEAPDVELLDATGASPYVDLSHFDKQGINCAVNGFYQRAFADAGRIAAALGEAGAARRWEEKAERIAAAMREAFWSPERGAFLDRRTADAPHTEPSVPGNALALFFGIAAPEQVQPALDWLAGAMLHNFRVPQPADNEDCNVTSYFSFYALGALYRHGRAREAEEFIRTYWRPYLETGNCWEYFVDNASRCHAWSSSPTHYLSSAVLGVGFPEPGNPRRVRIAPQPGTLAWAEGVYPLPSGPLHVSWRLQGGRLFVEYDAPEGVSVEVEA